MQRPDDGGELPLKILKSRAWSSFSSPSVLDRGSWAVPYCPHGKGE
jgi:hypothetical protein